MYVSGRKACCAACRMFSELARTRKRLLHYITSLLNPVALKARVPLSFGFSEAHSHCCHFSPIAFGSLCTEDLRSVPTKHAVCSDTLHSSRLMHEAYQDALGYECSVSETCHATETHFF